MFTRYIFWPWFTGLIFLLVGLFTCRKELSAAPGLDKLIVLGRVFVASPLATFGAEHLNGAQFAMQTVPAWMPARLFWAYFVGVALFAAAISFVLMKHVRLSATLLGVMFLLFVLMIHLPKAFASPNDRFAWAVALRDLAFAGGAWAFAGSQTAGSQTEAGRVHGSNWLILIGRLCIAIPVIFFGVEHFLHPEFVPVVPLGKLTPDWIPLRLVWGYLTGAVELVSGAGVLFMLKPRTCATWLGALITLLVLFIYLPILASGGQTRELSEGVNYLFDTLLFGGMVLLLATAMPRDDAANPPQANVVPAS